MAKGTQYSQQFKEDAVRYREDHPELTIRKAADNLGVSESALKSLHRTIPFLDFRPAWKAGALLPYP